MDRAKRQLRHVDARPISGEGPLGGELAVTKEATNAIENFALVCGHDWSPVGAPLDAEAFGADPGLCGEVEDELAALRV